MWLVKETVDSFHTAKHGDLSAILKITIYTLRVQKYSNDGIQHENVLSNTLIFFVVFDAMLVQNSFHKTY